MITWMQRHKKWLIITIWISTIAFVGAGFVGWGQYSYGDKAGSVAKVGEVEISMGELQKSYSNLYQQYSQMFQGNFDEERAKQFGLQKQALEQLINQALLINLAHSYNLEIADQELYNTLKSDKNFFKNGSFDKETYKQILAQNRITISEYENSLRKQLLVQKMLKLLNIEVNEKEDKVFSTLVNIADKIEYKVLSPENISIEMDDEALKSFWQTMKNNFKTQESFSVRYIAQAPVTESYDEAALTKYYQENKTHFKDQEGKILEFTAAKDAITKELNDAATKKAALKTYIDFKNSKLDASVTVSEATVSKTNNKFNEDVLKQLSATQMTKPFIKPIKVDNIYYTFELTAINPAAPKSFKEAKEQVIPYYVVEKKKEKVLELANNSVEHFTGKTSPLLTIETKKPLDGLSENETIEFVQQLFVSNQKRSFVSLNSGKIVLYNILEQEMLKNFSDNQGDIMARLKTSIFSEGLIKNLRNRYQTEIFIQGL